MENNWLDSVQIEGIIFERSDFGDTVYGRFDDDYAGGKRVKLSGRPSVKWIKIFETAKKTSKNGSPGYSFGVILLQPNRNEIIFTCKNIWTKTALARLKDLVEWVNTKCKEEKVSSPENSLYRKDSEYIERSRKYFEDNAG